MKANNKNKGGFKMTLKTYQVWGHKDKQSESTIVEIKAYSKKEAVEKYRSLGIIQTSPVCLIK